MSIETLYQHYLRYPRISTDTRNLPEGCIFFALKGPNFNANTLAEEALQKGASLAVVDDAQVVKNERYFLVADVLTTLQDLARHHRQQVQIPVIGLTGSNGKTTSKELTHAVLQTTYRTFATVGNLNNHIGVPLSVLSIRPEHEIAVIEMGANHVGEIALLSSIAQPSHGFITNIGKAHIGTFGGFENIIRGKSELFQYLREHNGVVFINSLNPILNNMAKRFAKPVLYPQQHDYYSCTLVTADPYIEVKAENGQNIRTHLAGAYNFENIAIALCIGKYFNVSAEKANQAIANYQPGNMRSQIIERGGNRIILDAYNANPSSMQAALENLKAMDAPYKVVILGDMFELEDEAEAEHKHLGKLIADGSFNEIWLCGKLMAAAFNVATNAHYFETRDALQQELKNKKFDKATILIKASRGIGLEKIVDFIN
jgi:UDP-N-acetylmuramoyl-tripeptide--D-alanyl-D-alanine ligase